MSRPRRRKTGGGGAQGNGHQQNGGGGGKARKAPARDFWGTRLEVPERVETVPVTSDPTAVVRSLGSPPLAARDNVAEAYFAAVYEKAAQFAHALAAADGVLEQRPTSHD